MGRRSLLLLLERIESGDRHPVREIVAPELIVRASTYAAVARTLSRAAV